MPYPTQTPSVVYYNKDAYNAYVQNNTMSTYLNGAIHAMFQDPHFEYNVRQYQPYIQPGSNSTYAWGDTVDQKLELSNFFNTSILSNYSIVPFIGQILSIDQLPNSNLYRANNLINGPVSILKPQFNVTIGVNTYPRASSVVNESDQKTYNSLSSTSQYFSYNRLIFSNYIHYNFNTVTTNRRGNTSRVNVLRLTPYNISANSPIQRTNSGSPNPTRITTYSPYSNGLAIDFSNDRTWIDSFFNNSFYWPSWS